MGFVIQPCNFTRLQVTFGLKSVSKCSDLHWDSEAAPSTLTQSWPWGSQVAVKKKAQQNN